MLPIDIPKDKRKSNISNPNCDDANVPSEIKEVSNAINQYLEDDENNFSVSQEKVDNLKGAIVYLNTLFDSTKNSEAIINSANQNIINQITQIFLKNFDENVENLILKCLWNITYILSKDKLNTFFSKDIFIDKLYKCLSQPTLSACYASNILSHLLNSQIISNYDINQLFFFIENIKQYPEDLSFYLFSLSLLHIPQQKIVDFLNLTCSILSPLESPRITDYCCNAICNCFDDINEVNSPVFNTNMEYFADLFGVNLPNFLISIQQKEFVKPIVKLFSALFDNQICVPFFVSDETINYLINLSINSFEIHFHIVIPLLSKIFFKSRKVISPEFINNILHLTSTSESSFKIRKSAVLFIAESIDAIIDDMPNYFHDFSFFELLSEMILSPVNDIIYRLLDCYSKLLSTQGIFAQYLEENEEEKEDILNQLDQIQDEMNSREIDELVYYIKDSINGVKPRSYEANYLKGSFR